MNRLRIYLICEWYVLLFEVEILFVLILLWWIYCNCEVGFYWRVKTYITAYGLLSIWDKWLIADGLCQATLVSLGLNFVLPEIQWETVFRVIHSEYSEFGDSLATWKDITATTRLLEGIVVVLSAAARTWCGRDIIILWLQQPHSNRAAALP